MSCRSQGSPGAAVLLQAEGCDQALPPSHGSVRPRLVSDGRLPKDLPPALDLGLEPDGQRRYYRRHPGPEVLRGPHPRQPQEEQWHCPCPPCQRLDSDEVGFVLVLVPPGSSKCGVLVMVLDRRVEEVRHVQDRQEDLVMRTWRRRWRRGYGQAGHVAEGSP